MSKHFDIRDNGFSYGHIVPEVGMSIRWYDLAGSMNEAEVGDRITWHTPDGDASAEVIAKGWEVLGLKTAWWDSVVTHAPGK